jgi:thiol-disulfide isomerase/thioredoxin
MIKHLTLLAAVLLSSTTHVATAGQLGVGDPAPKIDVSKWVKGEPVATFQKDHVYVVEFWATWCPPCRESIPHLTEMQKKNPNVAFIGVSVFERKDGLVEPFVEKMGDKMNYRVAIDSIPAGAKPSDGAMAKNWMVAAKQPGIPTAFIVNGQGTIAWIGGPMQMEAPLAKIVAGKWDIEAEKKLQAAVGKVNEAIEAQDGKAALAAIDALIALDAAREAEFGPQKFMLMLQGGSPDAYAYGAKLVDGVFKDSPDDLNGIAWAIVDPEGPGTGKRDFALAMRAATRANDLTQGKNPGILDTLAKVQFDSGEVAKAVETQQKAVDLAKGTRMEADLTERLEQYKKAAAKPKG